MSPANRPAMPRIPKPSDESKAFFESVVPKDHPTVTLRPMFGNPAAFAGGNLFMGLFGDDLFLRLPDEARAEVEGMGGAPLAPMPSRPMTGYVVVPAAWRTDPSRLSRWVDRSLEFALTLPPKEPKPKKKRG